MRLQQAGSLNQAKDLYASILKTHPKHVAALNFLGMAHFDQGRFDTALHFIDRAVAANPQYASARYHKGLALQALGRLEDAVRSFDRAIALKPDYPQAVLGRGVALEDLGQVDGALSSYGHAISLNPRFAEAYYNRGALLQAFRRLDDAIAQYDRALAISPDLVVATWNKATAHLLKGDFPTGWRLHESRWRLKEGAPTPRHFRQPVWAGGAIASGGTLLLHGEQGLGDTLQFCRYAPMIGPGVRVILEAPAPLVRLMGTLGGVDQVVAFGDPLPAFDLHCPLLSLPLAFATTIETIPASTPYLSAGPNAVDSWRRRLASLPGLKVGLVWAGDPRPGLPKATAVDARRSMRLAAMAPLGGVAGISFISLQKGAGAAQAAVPPPGLALHDFTAELRDFADTAALMQALDLVISVDTSVAHLAGALAKPVWLLNRYDTCWRWLLDRDDSPWYPTLRQFRQPSPGDWASVIDRVRDALRRTVEGDRTQLRAQAGVRTWSEPGA